MSSSIKDPISPARTGVHSVATAAVPEPGILALLGVGLMDLIGYRRYAGRKS